LRAAQEGIQYYKCNVKHGKGIEGTNCRFVDRQTLRGNMPPPALRLKDLGEYRRTDVTDVLLTVPSDLKMGAAVSSALNMGAAVPSAVKMGAAVSSALNMGSAVPSALKMWAAFSSVLNMEAAVPSAPKMGGRQFLQP
jgi:hypothetical protein